LATDPVGGFAFYSFTCSSDFCGIMMLVPIMPWPLLIVAIYGPRMLFDVPDSQFGAFVFAFLNAVIFYFVGALIESLIKKIKSRNNQLPLN
jgi:hypothetical protein